MIKRLMKHKEWQYLNFYDNKILMGVKSEKMWKGIKIKNKENIDNIFLFFLNFFYQK